MNEIELFPDYSLQASPGQENIDRVQPINEWLDNQLEESSGKMAETSEVDSNKGDGAKLSGTDKR